MRAFFRQPMDDVIACLGHLMTVRSPLKAMGPTLLAMVAFWFVYVPIHEILHVVGCVATGGEVSQLEIAPRYFGGLLAEIFPFVVSGSEYAGQLTGFDTKGNDLIYLATDFGPFVLTVLFGVLVIRLCARKRRPFLLGVGIVVGLAPFYNLPGDYYEMGSIITTRVVTILTGGPLVGTATFEGIRSDDVFSLIDGIFRQPAEAGLIGGGQVAVGSLLIGIALVVDVLLAFGTYYLGSLVANRVVGRERAQTPQSG